MSNATKVNADMVRATFKTPDARKGEKLLLEFINEKHDRQAAYLLRDHNESAITSPETYPRDQIDQLLSYYSVLFIAIHAGAIEPTEIVNELKRIKALLNYGPLERYYSETYPLLIPQIFSYFLEGKPGPFGERAKIRSESGVRLFFVFFDLTATFEFDSDIEWFLWILDGGSRKGWNLDRLFYTLESPEVGAAIFLDKVPNSGQRILRGLLKFLDLCRGLADLTDEELGPRSLRYLFLGYYEYWFRAPRNSPTSELSKNIDHILKLLDSQKSEVGVYLEAFRRIDHRVATLPVIIGGSERIALERKSIERLLE